MLTVGLPREGKQLPKNDRLANTVNTGEVMTLAAWRLGKRESNFTLARTRLCGLEFFPAPAANVVKSDGAGVEEDQDEGDGG